MLTLASLLPVMIFNIYYEHLAAAPNGDFPLLVTSALTCEQLELGLSLLTATIPNLKSFLKSFDTSLMMDISHKLPDTSRATSTVGANSQKYLTTNSNISKGSNSTPAPLSDISEPDVTRDKLRPEQLEHLTRVEASRPLQEGHRTHQDGRIRREVGWQVDKSQV
jgi:hypothetical protein